MSQEASIRRSSADVLLDFQRECRASNQLFRAMIDAQDRFEAARCHYEDCARKRNELERELMMALHREAIADGEGGAK